MSQRLVGRARTRTLMPTRSGQNCNHCSRPLRSQPEQVPRPAWGWIPEIQGVSCIGRWARAHPGRGVGAILRPEARRVGCCEVN